MTLFVDAHLHPPLERFLRSTLGPLVPAVTGDAYLPTGVDDLAEGYRRRGGRAVVHGWDAETASGSPPFTSADVADLVEAHPDVFVGFGSVDPHKGAKAISGVAEAKRLGLLGLSLHPAAQRFDPSDRRHASIWEVAEELDLVVSVHTGYTALGSGRSGGGGVDLSFADPVRIDRVAADFPDLRLVLAHPGWPWQDELLAVALHKPNVWLELSGRSPSLLSPAVVEALAGPLRERAVIGTGTPGTPLDAWLDGWSGRGLDDGVLGDLMSANPVRLLGL